MSVNQLKNKYPLVRTHFLTTQSVRNAIPTNWKQILRQNPRTNVSPQHKAFPSVVISGEKRLLLAHLRSYHFYNMLVEKHVPTAVARWATYGVQPQNWQNIYSIPYKCSTSTRLQSLHYRIINRYIPTRKYSGPAEFCS